MAKTFDPIATYTLSSTSGEISFTGLSGYNDYQIHAIYRTTGAANIYVRFNSNNSNYKATYEYSNSSANATSSQTTIYTNHPTTVGANYRYDTIDIINPHNSTEYKTCIIKHAAAADKISSVVCGSWKDVTTVTSIQLTSTGLFNTGSVFTIYGIKAA